MANVLIHAGMPKTGSTSIQMWLRAHFEQLRVERGIHVLKDVKPTGGEAYRFELYESGLYVNSNAFLVGYAAALAQPDEQPRLIDLSAQFAEALNDAASSFGDVLITSEGFATLFAHGEEPFLNGLESLAERHAVRVAYYVRPQHTALEARWREWGFRTGMTPSDWTRRESEDLRYAETFERVKSIAPTIDFDVRLFRPDLLKQGNVVVDFTEQLLGVDAPPDVIGLNKNLGIPLDLVNLLRSAPPRLLDRPIRSTGGGWRQGALGPIAQRWAVPESDEARASREVLQRYAFGEFEHSNRDLLARLGSPVASLVPQPDDAEAATASELLAELDRLWTPEASPTALAYLFAAVDALWNDDR